MSRFSRERRGPGGVPAAALLQAFFFDVLLVDDEDLVDRPLADRLAVLDRIAPALRLPALETADPAAAEAFAVGAVAAGHEGVMVKSLESTYQAGRRGGSWRKVKPVRTLDLVVLAAEWGHGRRTGWLSNLHLGARGADGGFVMVGKTFKGLTDDLLRWQTERLQGLAIGTEGHVVHVRPELVV
jgi:DNA ligase-1